MFQDLFSESSLLDLPIVTMLGFFAIFTGVCLRVASQRRRTHYDHMATLPLEED